MLLRVSCHLYHCSRGYKIDSALPLYTNYRNDVEIYFHMGVMLSMVEEVDAMVITRMRWGRKDIGVVELNQSVLEKYISKQLNKYHVMIP